MAEGPRIPLLDLEPYRADPGGEGGARFVEQLAEATHDVGFFHLVGHGVPPELDAELLAEQRRFFDLPEADRESVRNVRSPQFRGYTRHGHEHTNGRPDLRDQLDIGRELPAQALGPDDPPWKRLRGPNQWPAAQPGLRTVVTTWLEHVEPVGRAVLQAMARALGQPATHFDPYVSPAPETLLKLIRYHRRPEAGDSDQGVGGHRDTGFLSFILQDDVGGLQVEHGGGFVDVPRTEGAYVVNIGEMLQLVSCGYLKATVHRVIAPPPGVERMSAAYFFNPKLEARLEPVDLPAELAAQAGGGESIDPDNPILADYGENTLKVRLRAHPDVAERHHADLLAARRPT